MSCKGDHPDSMKALSLLSRPQKKRSAERSGRRVPLPHASKKGEEGGKTEEKRQEGVPGRDEIHRLAVVGGMNAEARRKEPPPVAKESESDQGKKDNVFPMDKDIDAVVPGRVHPGGPVVEQVGGTVDRAVLLLNDVGRKNNFGDIAQT